MCTMDMHERHRLHYRRWLMIVSWLGDPLCFAWNEV